jgi:hypothetical protein
MQQDLRKFFCSHKHRMLTTISLKAGNISFALCGIVFAILVARECRVLRNLEIQLLQ